MDAKALRRGFCFCIEFVEAFNGVILIAIVVEIGIVVQTRKEWVQQIHNLFEAIEV